MGKLNISLHSTVLYHFSLHSSECTDKLFTDGLWMHLVWKAKSFIPCPTFTTRHIHLSCNHLGRLEPEALI